MTAVTMQSTLMSSVITGRHSLLAQPPSRFSAVLEPPQFVASTRMSPARHVLTSRLRVRCDLKEHDSLCVDVKSQNNAYISMTQDVKERINDTIRNIPVSISPFDIAWIALVPSPSSQLRPCFPQCLEWILMNQNPNGSWSVKENHRYPSKHAMLSTLSCIIALKCWNVGHELIQRGLLFIKINSGFVVDKHQLYHDGFSTIFSRMIRYGKALGLNIPISEDIQYTLSTMHENKQSSNTYSSQKEACLAYLSEDICPIQDYDQLKKYQNKNGSIFNSPSATAAMLIRMHDMKAMDYLHSVVHKFGGAAPEVYPSDMSAHIHMVDSLEQLGIDYHFNHYIESVLDETYSAWLRNEEELISDMSTCALAFRILRMHGYDVSSEIFAGMDKEELHNSNCHPQNIATVLELYKASQLQICETETFMQDLNCWSRDFLEKNLSNIAVNTEFQGYMTQEVDYNLKFPFVENLQRLEHRRNIQKYYLHNVQYLKSSSRFLNIVGMDILKLAVDDFNFCQSMYQEEFKNFQRWAQESKISQLVRVDTNRLVHCYFTAAATITHPELSDARMSWAINSLLALVLDDFFDVYGSKEELENFMDLCTRWSPDYKNHCCSTQVYILFDAIYSTTNEFGAKASLIHGYSVISHLTELWVDFANAMNKEAEWTRNMTVPTLEEYMSNGYVSFGLGPILLVPTYFMGPTLSWDVIRSDEYRQLFRLLSTIGRLINDFRGLEREAEDHKPNCVSLKTRIERISEEDAMRELWETCVSSKFKLLELVVRRKDSVVPRECKDLFWNMYRVCSFFYIKSDGYRKGDFKKAIKDVLYDPICAKTVTSTN